MSTSLFTALDKRLEENAVDALTKSAGRIIQCPFCSYTEVMVDTVLSRAFPLFHSSVSSTTDALHTTLHTLFSVILFALVLYPVTIIYAIVLPDHFQERTSAPTTSPIFFPLLEPFRLLQLVYQYLHNCGRTVINLRDGNGTIFRCQRQSPNPTLRQDTIRADLVIYIDAMRVKDEQHTCGRQSCLTCFRAYTPHHRCFEDEEDGMRLAIEAAMCV